MVYEGTVRKINAGRLTVTLDLYYPDTMNGRVIEIPLPSGDMDHHKVKDRLRVTLDYVKFTEGA